MIINLSTINFDETGSGGGGTPARLQFRTVGIIANGMRNIMPNGYDGMAELTINTAISGETSAIDFYQIGYDYNLNEQLNSVWNNTIDYSKSLLYAWNPNNTSAYNLYKDDTNLIYAPNIDTSNVTNMEYMFNSCSKLTTVPLFNTSNVTDMDRMFISCSSLTSVPLFDTSNVTSMNQMFKGCSKLTTVPQFDTSKVTSMNYMFQSCSKLESLPLLDTSKVTNMGYMFSSCSNLTIVPQFNTSNVDNMSNMFSSCSKLTTIPLLDTSKVVNMSYMFQSCSKLESLPLLDFSSILSGNNIGTFFGYSNITTLTTLGGFKNLRINWIDNYGLAKCPNLTYQSVMNVINNLYDFRANGDTTTTRTLKLNANSLALLSDDDKAIATAKGWVLS